MSKEHIFELMALIKSTDGNPDSIVDAVWGAGYRQAPRTEQEAAQITIDTFFYCDMFDMPTDFWPKNYDSVLQNELMKAVLGEDMDLDTRQVAKRIAEAGYSKVVTDDAA